MVSARHRILIVDDDLDEQFLAKRALKKVIHDGSTIHLLSSGNQAISYMIGEGEYSDRQSFPFPSLILTDLAMPDGDGFDVLEFVGANPAWSVVPRIVFSASCDKDDVRTAYSLGASAYHVKPAGPAELDRWMKDLIQYWSSAEVPPVDENGRTLVTNSTGRLGARYPQQLVGGAKMQRPARRVNDQRQGKK